MFHSKYVKFACLIVVLSVLFCICIWMLNNSGNKQDITSEPQSVQSERENLAQKEPIQEVFVNPVQKYYKDNLEQEVSKFISNAKSSQNNDLEFSKLQMKFIKATDVLNEKYIENIDIKDSYYKNNWVKMPCVEGSYFYSVNSEYLLNNYGKYLSPAYREWLKFIIKREAVMQDGGLIVPPDTLREYIISIEKFVERYPDFVLISDAKDYLNSYLMTYLEGIDNSPIFDKWNTKKMLPEFKSSYEKFLSVNKDSKYYSMVEELYNKSKENNFVWDSDFDSWLYEYHKKYFAE